MSHIITEREIITRVLKQYKRSPCLWDPSNLYYYNKKTRVDSYEKILKIYKQIEPLSTLQNLKRKLEHFRAAYRREWKRVANSMGYNNSTQSVHEPSLWYYNLLTFLNVKSDGNQIVSSDEEDEDVCTEEPAQKKQRTSSTPSDSDKSEQKQSSESNTQDYATVYGLTIGKQLQELDDETRFEAERIISEVIYRARLGTLPKCSINTIDSLVIPQAEPSWYDVPTKLSNDEQHNTLVVTVAEPSDQVIKTELEEYYS